MTRGDAYIGLMSGTSLDGISACVVRFAESRVPTAAREARGAENEVSRAAENEVSRAAENSFELLAFEVREYNAEQREHLMRAMKSATAQEYCRLDFDLG